MGWLSIFKSAPKLVDDVFDKDAGLLTQMGSAIGNLHLSEQEIMINAAESAKDIRAHVVATMGESTDRSRARRELALRWFDLQIDLIRLYVFCIFFDYLIEALTGADPDFSNSVEAITLSPYLWGITGAVSLFFFGSHALRSSKFAKGEK